MVDNATRNVDLEAYRMPVQVRHDAQGGWLHFVVKLISIIIVNLWSFPERNATQKAAVFCVARLL